MKKLLFIIVIGLAGCSPSQDKSENTEQQNADFKEPVGYINNFFLKYKKNGPSDAIDYIFSTNKSITGVNNLKNKLDSIKNELGAYTGYEQIAEKNVGNGLVLFAYLVKYENYPVRFTFVFYKPLNNWKLYKFLSDTDVESELEYSGKIYFLK
jgi:hypothetical protein